MAKKIIRIKEQEIRIITEHEQEMFCLTDIARTGTGQPKDIIKNYLRNRATISFLGLWEQMHNPAFNVVEFDHIKNQTGDNRFSISSSEWIKKTNAIGIKSSAGRHGGTYAHKDITIHFTTWFSTEFYLYLIKEFQRGSQKNLEWHISKITDNIDEVRNLLDTIPGQKSERNRLEQEKTKPKK